MRIKKTIIEDNGLDLKVQLEILGISQREFAKHTPYKWYQINKYVNGLPCTEYQAKVITDALNRLIEPKA